MIIFLPVHLYIGNPNHSKAKFDLCSLLQLVTDMPRQQIQILREELDLVGGGQYMENTPRVGFYPMTFSLCVIRAHR